LVSRPNWTLMLAGAAVETVYWATWTLLVEVKTPGATTLTEAVADLVGSVLLVAVTATIKLGEPAGGV